MPTIVACPSCSQRCQLPPGTQLVAYQCPKCAQRFVPPGAQHGLFTNPATEGLLTAIAVSATCPYCGQVATFRSKRSRKCNHCGEWIYLRNGIPHSRAEADKLDAEKEAKERQERREYTRQKALELMKTLDHPGVSGGIPYLQFSAVADDRTPKTHLALERLGLNGTGVYRRDDPFWLKFMPPLTDFCRCTVIPLTIRMAAEAGVKEAQEWLRSNHPPAQPEWVKLPPFDPRLDLEDEWPEEDARLEEDRN
jgi:predicted RNA-binding Zn-ribbon protein involved in translation (DUF1610 family)